MSSLTAFVGAAEAARYVELQRRVVDSIDGVALIAPDDVAELDGDYRPGLIAFGEEAAGDFLAWDLRRSKPGKPAGVLYCDHELGLATPFARDATGAVEHLLIRTLVSARGKAVVEQVARTLSDFADVVSPATRRVLEKLAARARTTRAPVLANHDASRRAAAHLIPKELRGGWATIPPTYLPLLSPDDRGYLAGVARSYADAVEGLRELAIEERRAPFRWHLAAALRWYADVLLRLRRYDRAAEAAAEAIALYEPLHASGDRRVTFGLASVHRVRAVTERRARRLPSALDHATRALELHEESLLDASIVLDALDKAAETWERDLAGPGEDNGLALAVGVKATAAIRETEPPHPYRPQAERLARLATRRG